MNSSVVSTEPTSTMNITGFFAIERGFSFFERVDRRRSCTMAGSKIDFDADCLGAHLRRPLGLDRGGDGCGHVRCPWVGRRHSERCSRIGPSASAGKKVRPATMAITPASRAPNSALCVGMVPLVAGTFGLAASEPPMASTGMISEEAAHQHRDALRHRVPLRAGALVGERRAVVVGRLDAKL